MKNLCRYIVPLVALMLTGCMKWEYGANESFNRPAQAEGLFITCEGNFQYGNASLSYYDPETRKVENEIFYRANGMKLGDVAQSMTIHDGVGWIAVNNSHVLFAIDLVTFREVGRITNLPSPRYIHFISDTKAYVSQLWDNRIFIIDPKHYAVTGTITCPDMSVETGSTEQMVQLGDYLYVCCWSYQNRLLKIDTRTDEVVGQLVVGEQPVALVADRYDRLWVLTDGGVEGAPSGVERAALHCVEPDRFEVLRSWPFRLGRTPSELQIDSKRTTLYWLDDDVWSMSVDSDRLPVKPCLESRGTKYYGLTVNPVNGDIYVADAIDYQQPGMIYRYDAAGRSVDAFRVGVTPGAFCWK